MSRTKHHGQKSLFSGMSKFKKVTKRKRKAKEKQAIKNKDFDSIPKFKKTDKYDYL
jgi:hypothetical protein